MFSRGAIGFSTHKHKRLSRLIRWFTGQPWSHSFIVADIIGNRKYNQHRVYLLDAFKREASFNSVDAYLEPGVKFEVWAPKSQEQITLIDSAMKHVEKQYLKKPYSFAALVGIAIKLTVQRKFGWVIGNPLRLGVYCGQMVHEYMVQLGLGGLLQEAGLTDSGAVSPGDLYEVVTKSGLFEKVHNKEFDPAC